MQMSFGTLELAQRLKQKVLMNVLIDWKELHPDLTGLYKRELSLVEDGNH